MQLNKGLVVTAPNLQLLCKKHSPYTSRLSNDSSAMRNLSTVLIKKGMEEEDEEKEYKDGEKMGRNWW